MPTETDTDAELLDALKRFRERVGRRMMCLHVVHAIAPYAGFDCSVGRVLNDAGKAVDLLPPGASDDEVAKAISDSIESHMWTMPEAMRG